MISGQKRAAPESDEVVDGNFMPTQDLVQAGGMMLEQASKTKEMFSVAVSEARELVKLSQELFQIQQKKQEDTLHFEVKSCEIQDQKRAKELEHILAVARANAEALEIMERAKQSIQSQQFSSAPCPPDPLPNNGMYTTVPEGYITATMFYHKTFPTYKPRQAKDVKDFLNEVRTFAGQLYRDQNGRPMQVKEGLGSVDMYPTCWKGLARAFSEILYKFNNKADSCSQPLITGQFQLRMPASN